jgi:hypothetical protein
MKVVPLYAIGATVLQMCQSLLATIKQMLRGVRGYWQPSGNLFSDTRVLATNPLTNSLKGIGNFCK